MVAKRDPILMTSQSGTWNPGQGMRSQKAVRVQGGLRVRGSQAGPP